MQDLGHEEGEVNRANNWILVLRSTNPDLTLPPPSLAGVLVA